MENQPLETGCHSSSCSLDHLVCVDFLPQLICLPFIMWFFWKCVLILIFWCLLCSCSYSEADKTVNEQMNLWELSSWVQVAVEFQFFLPDGTNRSFLEENLIVDLQHSKIRFWKAAKLTAGVARVHHLYFKLLGTEHPTFRQFEWFDTQGALMVWAGVEGVFSTSACIGNHTGAGLVAS